MVILVPFFVALVAAFLPGLLWLFFFTREELHPEPKKIIAYAFSVGGLMSIPALAVQIGLKYAIPGSLPILALVVFAFVEETFKFFAIYGTMRKNPALGEPADVMIFAITAALGFATIENFFIIAGSWETLTSLSVGGAIETAALRFVGATFLHALAAGVMGYFWARGIIRKTVRISITQGLLAATLLHSFFNFLILQFQGENNLVYPSIFLIFILFFVLVDFEKLRGAGPFPQQP
ncbi:MAG: PrsW family glutamic-type intramembrane protease [Patescibacteria group bacterium]